MLSKQMDVEVISNKDPDVDFYTLMTCDNLLIIESGFGALAGSFNKTNNKVGVCCTSSTVQTLNDTFNYKPLKISSNPIIFILSKEGTGSTLLTNILYGLFQPTRPVLFVSDVYNDKLFIGNGMLIIKSHLETNYFLKIISSNACVVIYSQRQELGEVGIMPIHPSLTDYISIDYEEIKSRTTDELIEFVLQQLKTVLSESVLATANVDACKARLLEMNKMQSDMQHLPFRVCDPFYHIHGSHRARPIPVARSINNESEFSRVKLFDIFKKRKICFLKNSVDVSAFLKEFSIANNMPMPSNYTDISLNSVIEMLSNDNAAVCYFFYLPPVDLLPILFCKQTNCSMLDIQKNMKDSFGEFIKNERREIVMMCNSAKRLQKLFGNRIIFVNAKASSKQLTPLKIAFGISLELNVLGYYNNVDQLYKTSDIWNIGKMYNTYMLTFLNYKRDKELAKISKG
jgi:hypothetical protein